MGNPSEQITIKENYREMRCLGDIYERISNIEDFE